MRIYRVSQYGFQASFLYPMQAFIPTAINAAVQTHHTQNFSLKKRFKTCHKWCLFLKAWTFQLRPNWKTRNIGKGDSGMHNIQSLSCCSSQSLDATTCTNPEHVHRHSEHIFFTQNVHVFCWLTHSVLSGGDYSLSSVPPQNQIKRTAPFCSVRA